MVIVMGYCDYHHTMYCTVCYGWDRNYCRVHMFKNLLFLLFYISFLRSKPFDVKSLLNYQILWITAITREA
jgi:hypothetical protein